MIIWYPLSRRCLPLCDINTSESYLPGVTPTNALQSRAETRRFITTWPHRIASLSTELVVLCCRLRFLKALVASVAQRIPRRGMPNFCE